MVKKKKNVKYFLIRHTQKNYNFSLVLFSLNKHVGSFLRTWRDKAMMFRMWAVLTYGCLLLIVHPRPRRWLCVYSPCHLSVRVRAQTANVYNITLHALKAAMGTTQSKLALGQPSQQTLGSGERLCLRELGEKEWVIKEDSRCQHQPTHAHRWLHVLTSIHMCVNFNHTCSPYMHIKQMNNYNPRKCLQVPGKFFILA